MGDGTWMIEGTDGMMAYTYADVIIDISHEKVDRAFQYRIPEGLAGLVGVGVCVRVPFGKGNVTRKGYVVELSNTPEFDTERMKEIADVVSENLSVQSQLIKLAWWMKKTYGSTMNQALKTVLPVKQKVKPKEKKRVCCLMSGEELLRACDEAERKNYKARLRLLKAFMEMPVIPMEMIHSQLQITPSTLKPMIDKGQVEVVKSEVCRTPFKAFSHTGVSFRLNTEQAEAVGRFCRDYDGGVRKPCLLHGITGSGKTEVYMEFMDHVLNQGRQVILLIPEIALTYQTVMRFYRRFGDKIAIINSRLSAGERYDQWERAAKGEVSVMIGPRSALFTPFQQLGLIIIDEEHEGAYKSETTPRYHARDVAEMRAKLSGASLILGSATPSVEAYTKSLAGEYGLFTLKNRAVKKSALSIVDVVDMRKEMAEGNKSMFSGRLTELIGDRLSRREQIMLFINRRGYSNFISCRSCGEAVKCPHCDVSLTLHKHNRLVCHYCGYSAPLMKLCPSCGSPYIAGFGAGTQKLVELTGKAFPGAGILRMDADTTAKKRGHEEILAAFSAHEADILIGTQMIVKGHDFGNVTLVGIMAADLSLNTPDFRCGERTFQLLTQAAGRAGRGTLSGNVVIQTYQPDHYAIVAAAKQNYEMFYQQEIIYRKMMNYPPACFMAAVLLSGGREEQLESCSNLVFEKVLSMSYPESMVQMIGPVNAPVYKVNDIYRKILYIKSKNCDILDKIRSNIELLAGGEQFKSVALQFDLS